MDLEWQGELESLLSGLGVSLGGPLAGDPQTVRMSRTPSLDDQDILGDELAAVRGEVEATLARVLSLVRDGRIDLTTRDDIILVLRALLQPREAASTVTPTPDGEENTREWEFASAATILRFCRLVLYFTQAVA